MKTTIELSDALLVAAKKRAAKQGTTLRALVEQGLSRVLRDSAGSAGFKLRDASVEGKGLTPGARGMAWSELRALANERDPQ
jgi:hypothetical protein